MRALVRRVVYAAIAMWAAVFAGDGRDVRGASPSDDAETAAIIVKSVKPEVSPPSGIVAYGLTRSDYRHLVAQIPNLRRAIPVREATERAQYRGQSLDVRLIGTTEAFAGAHAVEVARGRFLTEKDLQRLDNLAVITRGVASRFFLDEDPIGKSIRIDGTYFLIVGVASERSAWPTRGAGLQVFVPLSTMRARRGDLQLDRRKGSIEAEQYELSRIEIIPEDPVKIEATAGAIRRMLQAFHEEPDYSVEVVRQSAGR